MNKIFAAFTSRRMFVTLLLGFASGLPFALSGATLQAWMADQKVDLAVIGIFSLVALPYSLKFIWAPFMDRYVPPFLGRRRGWMIIAQFALAVVIFLLGQSDPVLNPAKVAFIAVLVAFFSASQDVVIDAYRTEVLPTEEYGIGSGVYVMAYRIAMITSGGGALVLADHMPWSRVYTIMAVLMGLGALGSLIGPEPTLEAKPPKSIKEAVMDPFLEFFKRKGAIETLLFLLLYKLDVFMTLAMQTPFLLEIGFSKTDIGVITKFFGMGSTILGALFGGGLMLRLGMERSLWVFGAAQALAGLSYMLLAHIGANHSLLVFAIGIENLCSGMGIAAYSGFMMSLCDRRFTATQYALLTSFMGLSRSFVQTPSGFLAKAIGWEYYFLVCALIGIPGLLLLTRFKRWYVPGMANK
ncbi:MAG TPA: AmpG family muropeptide MFS transporter [Oligoflexia bacterium]|nr:AmpG family muropeptide MFS transporter [Oligoflexia bacterium]